MKVNENNNYLYITSYILFYCICTICRVEVEFDEYRSSTILNNFWKSKNFRDLFKGTSLGKWIVLYLHRPDKQSIGEI